MTTGRLRRYVLPVALLGAVLLGAGGASAPANAQYPYYGAYYPFTIHIRITIPMRRPTMPRRSPRQSR